MKSKSIGTRQSFLMLWIVFLSCIAVFSLSLAEDKLPEIVKKIEPSVVVITTYDREGKILGQGSGFFISNDGDVITNWHVLRGANRAEVKTPEGKLYLINRVLAEDKEGCSRPLRVGYRWGMGSGNLTIGKRI